MDIAILLYEGVTALDAVGPYEVLARLPEAKIHFVAKDLKPIQNDLGNLTMVPHYRLADISRPDVILIPGASASFRSVMSDRTILDWIVAAHLSAQWTTSVCTGSLILGAAGLLRGLKATTHWMVMDSLTQFGAVPTHERIVQQGKIITAAGVSAGIDMALHLLAEIKGEEFPKVAQLMIEYDPQPPFNSGHPRSASVETVETAKHNLAREAARQSQPNDSPWAIENTLMRSSRPGYSSQRVSPAEVDAWISEVKALGIESIICLLANDELHFYGELPNGLIDYYRKAGFTVAHIAVRDYQSPPLTDLDLRQISEAYHALPKPVLVHCSAGIDRTGKAVEYIRLQWSNISNG